MPAHVFAGESFQRALSARGATKDRIVSQNAGAVSSNDGGDGAIAVRGKGEAPNGRADAPWRTAVL